MKNKLYKLISLFLSVVLLVSACVCRVIVSAETEPKTGSYYVMSTGYANTSTAGDGRTEQTPAETVEKVLETIKADGLKAGDTAIVYILQNTDNGSDATTYDTTQLIGTYTDENGESWTNRTPKHNMTAWCDAGSVQMSYDYTLVLRSPEGQNNALTFSSYIGNNAIFYVGGPTIFENVTLVATRTECDRPITIGENDVVFGEETAFGVIRASYTSKGVAWERKIVKLNLPIQFGSAASSFGGANVTINAAYDITQASHKNANRNLYISSNKGHVISFSEDVNIVINNGAANVPIKWGNNGAAKTTTFAKNLNINVKSAESVTNSVVTTPGAVTANAVQIISAVDFDMSAVTNLTATNGIWNLKNTTGNPDLLTFAKDENGDTIAGKYIVDAAFTATATDESGKTYYSVDGILDLSKVPGTYTLTATKAPVNKNYYVMSTGYANDGVAGDGRSEKTPAATVADVIPYIIEDGLVAGDTANVYILQDPDGVAAKPDELPEDNLLKHNITSWAKSGGNLPAHSFTLVIKSPEDQHNYLASGSYLGKNASFGFGGPTIIDNVTLVLPRSYFDGNLYYNGNDVTITKNAKTAYINYGSPEGALKWTGAISSNDIPMSLSNADVSSKMSLALNHAATFSVVSSTEKRYLYIASRVSAATFAEDVNITINHPEAQHIFSWGALSADVAATFSKSLSINIKDAKKITNRLGTGTVTIKNGLQILYPSDVEFDMSAITNLTADKKWILSSDAPTEDAISFVTDKETGDTVVGKYAIDEQYTVVAADKDGEIVAVSDDGLLDLSQIPGTYELRFVEQFDNDGTTLKVYEPGEIDLATVSHDEIEGKIFIGWAFSDGTYPKQVDTYKFGDVLTAQYIDYATSDFVMEQTEVRDDKECDPSLRFVFNEKKGFPNITERGILWLTINKSYAAELYIDTPTVVYHTMEGEWVPDVTGGTPYNVKVNNILEESEEDIKYTLCLTDIDAENYDTYYVVRGYIKYADNNGVAGLFYGHQAQSSLYKTAAEAENQTETEKAIVDYVEGDRITNYWLASGLTADGEITESTTKQYMDVGCCCTDKDECDHKVFTLKDGLYVRDITINTGLNTEKTTIGFISDTHFSGVDDVDIKSNSAAMNSFRNRGDMKKSLDYYPRVGLMRFMSICDKGVTGGDSIDYLSNRTVLASSRYIAQQSVYNRTVKYVQDDGTAIKGVGGSINMVLGNHDPKQGSTFTQSEAYEWISKYWPNDLYYHSEIMLDKDGNDNIMMIYIDNNYNKYWESQIAPLTRDLTYARQNNVPVLIFQHIPLQTRNANEYAYKEGPGEWYNPSAIAPQDDSYYTIDENGTYIINQGVNKGKSVALVDYATGSGKTGYGKDEATTIVYNLIRSHADVIKGVFAGHVHASTNTQIIGLDIGDNPLTTEFAVGEAESEYTIPQYTNFSGRLTATRITVK